MRRVLDIDVGLLDTVDEQHPSGRAVEVAQQLDGAAQSCAHATTSSVGVAPGSTGTSSGCACRVAPTDATMTQTMATHSRTLRCSPRKISPETAAKAGSIDISTLNTDARIRRSANSPSEYGSADDKSPMAAPRHSPDASTSRSPADRRPSGSAAIVPAASPSARPVAPEKTRPTR